MLRARHRLWLLILALPLVLVVSAGLYMVGMAVLEGEPRGFWYSLEWAAETLSTTGYGADSTWQHPLMVIFVVALQFVGVFLVFLVFPIYLIPFLEERFEARLPQAVPEMSGHLVVFRYGPAVESLLRRARRAGLETLVVETDLEVARGLVDSGQRVLFGSLEGGVLDRAWLPGARALIANSSDEEDAAAILGARQQGFRGEALALVEEPSHRQPMALAGASAVYTPRHVLAAALAARASRRIGPTVSGVQHLGGKLSVDEFRIPPDSELAGRTLAEADIGRRTGAIVIGQWLGGELRAELTAATRIEPRSILIVAGSEEGLERFDALCSGAKRRSGPFLVAGFGEVGQKVVQLLQDAGEQVRAVDRRPAEGVDLVADVLDTGSLEAAGANEARAVILALDSDSATLFATVIVRSLAPLVPVIARVNRSANVNRIHQAGADFALSISEVSGQILARRIFGEEAISLEHGLKVVRVGVGGLVGRDPAELRIRERTGCSVVAVERGDDLVVEFGDGFRFAEGDAVYLSGTDDAVRSYREAYEPV